MLSKYNLLEKMKKHFSRWMDIRKRTMNSTGGNYLYSISEEIEDLNIALEEYRKDFYFRTYMGKEQEIPYIVKRATVGELDKYKIDIPNFELAKNKKEFYTKENTFFYEDGYIYLKNEYPEMKLTYTYKKYNMINELEYYHVWNIYDEFATFVGLTRYNMESNEELVKRIKEHSIKRPNKTEEGLKNAILNTVVNEGLKIKPNDISIERTSPENLRKHKEYFEDIIEKLIFVNKDVLRAKRWDIDVWEYGLDNIDYIPHMWDVILEEYQDGVGYNSLKTSLSNYPSLTNVRFSFYNKTAAIIDKYIKDKKMKHNVNIKLTKYKGEVETIPVEYKIEASEIKDISNNNIEVKSYNFEDGIYDVRISDILSQVVPSNIEQNINIDLKDKEEYSIVFSPTGSYKPMNIHDFSVIKNGKKISYIDDIEIKHPFVKEDGKIYNTKTKRFINRIEDCIKIENLKNNNENKTIEMVDIRKPASMLIDINEAESSYLKLDYVVEESNITEDNIKLYNMEQIGNNSYKNTKKYGDIILELEANYISFEIEGMAEVSINNNEPIVYSGKYETEETQEPQKYKIKIMDFEDDLIVKNLKYKNYKIIKETEKGEIQKINDIEVLPTDKDNKLLITIETNTGRHITINQVYIGMNTENDNLIFSSKWDKDIEDLVIKTDCKMSLYKNNTLIEDNFYPLLEYTSKGQDNKIAIDLSSYKDYKILDDTTIKKSLDKEYLYLKKDTPKSTIKIEARKIKDLDIKRLNKILPYDETKDKLYITNACDEVIIKNIQNEDKKITLSKDLISPKKEAVELINLDEDISVEFVINKDLDERQKSKIINKDYQFITLGLEKTNKHVAVNHFTMLNNEHKNIDIIHNFLPPLEEHKEMYYELVEFDPNTIKTTFSNTNNKNWSINKRTIDIKYLKKINEKDKYHKEVSFVNKDFILSREIYLDRYINGVDLTTGILEIEEPGHKIIYKSKMISDDYNNASEFYEHEEIIQNEYGVTKLKCSNIDDIIYIGKSKWNGRDDHINEIDDSSYTLLKKEGMIVWNENIKDRLNIVYTIKIPHKIVIEQDLIYNKVSIPIDALQKIEEKEKTYELYEDVIIPINTITEKEFDILKIEVDNINIDHSIIGENVILSNKNLDPKSIAITPGYYYIDGEEYYLFNEELSMSDKKNKNIIKENIKQKDGYLIFKKEAYNFIENSDFILTDEDTIYYADFENDAKLKPISDLGAITSCDDYNLWNVVNLDVKIVEGINDEGFYIQNKNVEGYMYIDITDYIKDNQKISMFADKGIRAYIGIGHNINNNIEYFIKDTMQLQRNGDFLQLDLKDLPENKRVFLVVLGEGKFDDILISNNLSNESHIPIIKRLNIIKNTNTPDKIIFKNIFNKAKNKQTESTPKTCKLTSSIHWGDTEILNLNSKEDWKNLVSREISYKGENIKTSNLPGYIQLPKINNKQVRTIKDIKIKINDLDIKKYNGFKIDCFTGDRYDEVNQFVESKFGNYVEFKGDNLKNYVYFKVNIPSNTIIENIQLFIQYKEALNQKPRVVKYTEGTSLTRIFDSEKEDNYKIKSMNFNKLIGSKHIKAYVRGGRQNINNNFVWTDWKEIKFTKGQILNDVRFFNYKLFQFKFEIRSRNSYIDIENIELERFS